MQKFLSDRRLRHRCIIGLGILVLASCGGALSEDATTRTEALIFSAVLTPMKKPRSLRGS